MPMGMTPTLIIIVTCLIVGFWAWWQERKPYVPGKLPLIPYAIILYACLIIILLMVAHMVELFTGTPLKGRMSRGF